MDIEQIKKNHKRVMRKHILILVLAALLDIAILIITKFHIQVCIVLALIYICLMIWFICVIRKLCYLYEFYSFVLKEKLANEFSDVLLENAECFFTKNYIFKIKEKIYIKYADIILMYACYVSQSPDEYQNKICLVSSAKTKFLIENFGSENESFNDNELVRLIMAQNPNILIGKTKENKKIILDKYNLKV